MPPLENHFSLPGSRKLITVFSLFTVGLFHGICNTLRNFRTKEKCFERVRLTAVTPHIEEYYKKYSVQTYLIYSGWVEHDNRSLIPNQK